MRNKEKAVREAAAALKDAIDAARGDGYVIAWPSHSGGLAEISISETSKAPVTIQVRPGDLPPEVIAKAGAAAQKAVDKELAKAAEKGDIPKEPLPADLAPTT